MDAIVFGRIIIVSTASPKITNFHAFWGKIPVALLHPRSPVICAETARTVVNLVGFGTLATRNGDEAPLGTFVSYVLDKAGIPVLRMR